MTPRPIPTRQRILDAALALFNDRGASEVTTHDIAAACGMSPGNLYYHFRNKEEIVRALFDEAIERHHQRQRELATSPGRDRAGELESLKEFNWRYRFFKRELPTLLQRDRRLRSAFLAFQHEHLAQLQQEIGRAATAGELRPLSADDQRMLAELSWLILLFWPSYAELGGRLTRGAVDRGVELVGWLFSVLASREPAPATDPATSGATKGGPR